MNKILIDVKQLSESTGLSVFTLYSWINQKRIPYVKVGRIVRFDPRKNGKPPICALDKTLVTSTAAITAQCFEQASAFLRGYNLVDSGLTSGTISGDRSWTSDTLGTLYEIVRFIEIHSEMIKGYAL